ncbi:MAG: hypothetical protein ACREJM_00005 [Candidatus Saccharimonadales bacterium]
MSTPITQTQVATLTPARGIREFSTPGDPSGFVGVSGVHFNQILGLTEILAGLPLAGANATGASYLSAIHGGLGSDPVNPLGTPAAGFDPNIPAFPNPEVTGYYVPPNPLATNQKQNGFFNTEKIQREASDATANMDNGTVWIGLQGRTKLNFQLWISSAIGALGMCALELYRDLNAQDKVGGVFGPGTGPGDLRNALLVASWIAPGANQNQNMPNFATSKPFDLPSGCNLYLLFRSLNGVAANQVVGSIWLS